MTKLDWEKRNRSELVTRVCQYYDSEDPSQHEILLRDCGFPPSLGAIEVVNTSLAEWRKSAKNLRLTVSGNSNLQREQKQEVAVFLERELKDIYAQIVLLRLVALYPSRLSIDCA